MLKKKKENTHNNNPFIIYNCTGYQLLASFKFFKQNCQIKVINTSINSNLCYNLEEGEYPCEINVSQKTNMGIFQALIQPKYHSDNSYYFYKVNITYNSIGIANGLEVKLVESIGIALEESNKLQII